MAASARGRLLGVADRGRRADLFLQRIGRDDRDPAGPEYKELAVNHLDDAIMSTPAVSGHALFIRTTTSLYRIENRASGGLKTAEDTRP